MAILGFTYDFSIETRAKINVLSFVAGRSPQIIFGTVWGGGGGRGGGGGGGGGGEEKGGEQLMAIYQLCQSMPGTAQGQGGTKQG